ncbi:hypothetical protein N802_11470 [Knoellia sinensis KCTC 19936]|uniref:Uncharacterized protein n=1 Tax=Knoellia sinensis KCTC 19936 TaxID=1385520 RepID=A0A0A0J1B4_9MICO|nr:hypothetical protein [Knoellia sinensis]KGN29411.1 hypothetical protein N802_11470 [Knoellia sinensis KCTC 19936]
MSDQPVQPRVAAMLSAYEARSIDGDELYARLLKTERTDRSTNPALRDLLDSVSEATDLGQDERELIAWAAARYWRTQAEDS